MSGGGAHLAPQLVGLILISYFKIQKLRTTTTDNQSIDPIDYAGAIKPECFIP